MFWKSLFLPKLTPLLTDNKPHQPKKKWLQLGKDIFFLFSNSSLERVRYNHGSLKSISKKLLPKALIFISCLQPYSYAFLP